MATRIESVDDMGPLDALKVGLVQCLAMVPGTSRSGATIIGGMLLGLSRKAATDFSFFLAIPTLIGAGVYSLYKERSAALLGRCADVPHRAGVLVHQRLAVCTLAAALHQYAQFCGVCLYRIVFGVVVLATAWLGVGAMGRMNMLREVVAVAAAFVCCATGSALAEDVGSQATSSTFFGPRAGSGCPALGVWCS